MAAADASRAWPVRRLRGVTGVGRLLPRRPELGAAAAVAGAWVLLVLAAARASRGELGAGLTAMGGTGAGGVASPRSAWSLAAGGLPYWVVMTTAMMGPATLASVRHTGLNSLRWRRNRAMAEFSAAYLAVWAAFGVLALAAAARVPAAASMATLAVVLMAAAAWQLTPVKRRWLRACHRSVPLPPSGWRAEWGALRFGLRNGLACLGSCWCLMLVMAVAPGGQLLWTTGLTVTITSEKLLARQGRATRFAAAALAFAAVAAAALGNLFR